MKPAPNPANEPDVPDDFRPMTSGMLKLEVPERPGFNRHWFRGNPGRLAQARRAGYRYVENDGTFLNNIDIAGDAATDGNSDLGTRVSLVSGEGLEEDGQPSRLYLMECPDHLFALAQKVITERNESVADSLRTGLVGSDRDVTQSDRKSRYTKGGIPDLFNPNKRRPGV